MNTFILPNRNQVSSGNKKYFDFFNDRLGMMPNIYAMMAYADQALESYIQLQNRKQKLNLQEWEVVGLVVAAVNGSAYCLESHTMIAYLNGLTEEQVTEIKGGTAGFDPRIDALARITHDIVISRGRPDEALLEAFFSAGYTIGHLVDLIVSIGNNTISNLLCQVMQVPPDDISLPFVKS
ncbi:MAG TPA: carboxymuconolactone decarboxylase family protein [Puia sp.]